MTPTLVELDRALRAHAIDRANDCAAWATEAHASGLDRPHRAPFWQDSAVHWWAAAFFWLRMAGPPRRSLAADIMRLVDNPPEPSAALCALMRGSP